MSALPWGAMPSRRRLAAVASALAPCKSWPSAAALGNTDTTPKAAEPTVFLYDDGRHASPLYQFAPPLSADDLAFTVDQLSGSGADTLLVSAGLEGGPVHYASQCAPLWGANVDVWEHLIFYRASRNLHQLVVDGLDPMALLCDRARSAGLFFLPTLPLCIVGQSDTAVGRGLGRTSEFACKSTSDPPVACNI